MVPLKPSEVLAPGKFQDKITSLVPEITRIAEIEVQVLFNLDSSDMGIEQWEMIAEEIYKKLYKYDGFVIIHGTDTMVYTAAALSFSLINLNKPVVLTGAQRPLSKLRNDARLNLIDAVELASMDIPEVIIVFGQRILRGNRAKKISIHHFRAFHSPNYPYLGEIGVDIRLEHSKLLKRNGSPVLLKGFNAGVAVLSVHPSMAPEGFINLLDSPILVYILEGFGAGNLPVGNQNWISFIENAVQKDKLIFIGSHSMDGRVDLNLYAGAQKALAAGAHGLGAMTIEAAYVKLQKVLAQTQDKQEILQKFSENWAGEI